MNALFSLVLHDMYLDVKSYCRRIFKLFDVIIDDVLILSDLVGFLCIFAFFLQFHISFNPWHSNEEVV